METITPSPWSRAKVVEGTLSVAFVVLLSCMGGLLNRIRGGWGTLHCSTSFNDSVLGHDACNRFVFAIPTGVLVAYLARKPLLGLLVAVLTFFTLYVGWGCYFDIGRNAHAYNSRAGVFDWLVGRSEQDWSYGQRWLRDISGMGLRGLLWTMPSGLPFFYYGYGWQYMFSGAMMGFVYELAYDLPITTANFSQGTALGEMLWGTWLWFVLIVSIVSFRGIANAFHPCRRRTFSYYASSFGIRDHSLSQSHTEAGPISPVWSLAYRLFHAFTMVLTTLFLISLVWYATQVQQTDHRNWLQSVIGTAVATVALIVLQLVALLVEYCILQRRTTHWETRSEAIEHLKESVSCCCSLCDEEHVLRSSSTQFHTQSTRNANVNTNELTRSSTTLNNNATSINQSLSPLTAALIASPTRRPLQKKSSSLSKQPKAKKRLNSGSNSNVISSAFDQYWDDKTSTHSNNNTNTLNNNIRINSNDSDTDEYYEDDMMDEQSALLSERTPLRNPSTPVSRPLRARLCFPSTVGHYRPFSFIFSLVTVTILIFDCALFLIVLINLFLNRIHESSVLPPPV